MHNPLSQEELNVRRSLQHIEEGQYSKAKKALTSLGIAHDVKAALQELHPHQAPPVIPPDPSPQQLSLTPDQVADALHSFDEGSAPGPSLMRASFFKNAIFTRSPQKAENALKTMTRVLNLMATGKFPSEVQLFLCGARLIVRNKKKEENYRPIAIGEVLRHWLSKGLSRVVTPHITPYLHPLQLAVGTKEGAEAIIHAMSTLFGDNRPIDSKWFLQIDLTET
jgi:hypothetical protein